MNYNADKNKKNKLKLKSETIETKIDEFGNRIEGVKTETFTGKNIEDNYIKMYVADIAQIYKMPARSADCIVEILRNEMSYNGEFNINKRSMARLCENWGSDQRSITNYIKALVENDVIKRVGKGCYIVNPYLFAKGDWEHIKGLRVIYNNDGQRELSPIYGEDFKELNNNEQGE